MGVMDRYGRDKHGNVVIDGENPTIKGNTSVDIDCFIQQSYAKSIDYPVSKQTCGYCGKLIEAETAAEINSTSTLSNGLVIQEFEERVVKRQNVVVCSKCGGMFCQNCVTSYYKNKDSFVKTNVCKRCNEQETEAAKLSCEHYYKKTFLWKDNHFDYYEKECVYCGDKKGIAEPIEKIKSEPPQKTVVQSVPVKQSAFSKIKGWFKNSK